MKNVLLILFLFIKVLFLFSQKTENEYYIKAKELRSKAKYDSSIKYFLEAKKIFKENNDSIGLSKSLNYLGLNYKDSYNSEKAIENFYKAIELNKKINYKRGLTINYINLANYYNSTNTELALYYYQEALKLVDNESNKINASLNLNIGTIYASDDSTYSNKDSAIYYYLNSLKVFEELKDTTSLINLYHNLGLLYERSSKLDVSLDNYRKALEFAKTLNVKSEISEELMAVGVILLKKEDPIASLNYFEKSLSIAENIGDEKRKMHLYSNIVKAKMQLGEVNEASYYFEKFNNLRDGSSFKSKITLKS